MNRDKNFSKKIANSLDNQQAMNYTNNIVSALDNEERSKLSF